MIDLRSDTVTKPTEEMLEAMLQASIGDDGLGDRSSVTELEELGASMLGKEAGLFVPAGMMGNGLAIRLFVRPGDRVVCAESAHLFGTGLVGFAGATPALIRLVDGHMDPQHVKGALARGAKLLCLENSCNSAGGEPWTVEETQVLAQLARDVGAEVHLDGARLFNAAVSLGVSASELVRPVTTAMFCLSKGLSAPVGSLLVGPRVLIDQARELRHLLGGSMRQAGLLAACGIVSLRGMVERLAIDHENLGALARGLEKVPYVRLSKPAEEFKTNIVFFTVGAPWTPQTFVVEMEKRGVSCLALGGRIRMVTHRHISRSDVEQTLNAMLEIA